MQDECFTAAFRSASSSWLKTSSQTLEGRPTEHRHDAGTNEAKGHQLSAYRARTRRS